MKTSTLFLKRGTFTRNKYNRILIASTLSWCVYFIDSCADSLLAGILLDEAAVSAVALVQPITTIISFMAFLISVGTVTVFSRESGAFHKEEAYKCVGQGFICSAAISVFLVSVMLLFRESYLAYYQASLTITDLARDYYSCEIFFAAIYPVYYIIYQIVAIDGDEICSFIAALVSAVTNILVSYLLAGKYGITGLALGSVAGCAAALLAYGMHFLSKTNSVHIRLHFNIHEVFEVVKIGSATSITFLYVAIIDIVMNRFVIARFGDIYLPAYAIVNFILNMGAVFGGLYDSCSGFIGVAYGEKNPESISQTMKISLQGLVVITAITMVVLEILAPYVPNLYGITDSSVYDASVFASRIIPLAFPALAFYYLFGSYYVLTGRIWLGHLLSAVYMLISPIVLAIPLGILFGFNGLSVGFMLTSITAVSVTLIVILLKYGKKAVPLILEKTDEEALFYELVLSEEGISALCEKVKDELLKRNINSSVVNEVQLILEESYMTIMENNPDKKVLTECNLLISDKTLRVITRDNGKIFDITDANAKVKDLRSYVLAQLMEHNPNHSNTTTVSFNRNSYFWQLKEPVELL